MQPIGDHQGIREELLLTHVPAIDGRLVPQGVRDVIGGHGAARPFVGVSHIPALEGVTEQRRLRKLLNAG